MERMHRPQSGANEKTTRLVNNVEDELRDSLVPVSLTGLSAADRRLVHQHFDHNTDIVTKTYKITEEEYELRIYPVGNLRRFAEKRAQEAIQSGQKAILPPMSSFERFVIHEALQKNEALKVASFGEGPERHIEIEPNVFGRGLKKVFKKIKLF
jgi:predicted RNA-binding protein Jag